MNKRIKLIIGISLNALAIVIAIFLIYSVGNRAFEFGAKVFDEQAVDSASSAREVEVTIPENITTSQLADLLFQKGLIDDKSVFYVQVELSEYKDKFAAGTYTLNTSMTSTKIMKVLASVKEE